MGCKLLIHDSYEQHPTIPYHLVVQIASPQCFSRLDISLLCVVHLGMPEQAPDPGLRLVQEDKLSKLLCVYTVGGQKLSSIKRCPQCIGISHPIL